MTDESQLNPEFEPTVGQPAETPPNYEAPAAPAHEAPAAPAHEAPAAPAHEAPAAQWPTEGYPPPPTYPAPLGQEAHSPVAYPVSAAPGVQPAQTSSNAVVAIILAVISWAVCPLIPAIVALVFASNAHKEIAASGGRVQGQGLVTAARIVSWVNIGLWAAIIVVGAFFLVLAVVAGGLGDSSRY